MTYFLLSLSCFSSSLASSAVLTRISMHIGFLFSSSLSTGGFGTQLNDTLVLPWRFVGMLLVREMFSRMLPVNIQLTFSQVYNPLLPEPINLGLTWSKFPGFQHWKMWVANVSLKYMNLAYSASHTVRHSQSRTDDCCEVFFHIIASCLRMTDRHSVSLWEQCDIITTISEDLSWLHRV